MSLEEASVDSEEAVSRVWVLASENALHSTDAIFLAETRPC